MNDDLQSEHKKLISEVEALKTEAIELVTLLTFLIRYDFDSDVFPKIAEIQSKLQAMYSTKRFILGIEYATKGLDGEGE